MIEAITSSRDGGVSIKLLDPLASEIYQLDSINLIIGDNGSGKTRLIRSILRDLLNESDAQEYVFKGSLENLGLVYYTAAPFHSLIKTSSNSTVSFVDASPGNTQRRKFVQTAREYVEVKDLLDLNVPMGSVIYGKYETIVAKLFAGSLGYNDFRNWGSPALIAKFDEYKSSVQVHGKLNRARNELSRRYESESGTSKKRLNHDLFVETDYVYKMRELEDQLLVSGKIKIGAREQLMSQFLIESKPKTKRAAIKWLAALSLPDKSFNAGRRNIEVLRSLYINDDNEKIQSDLWASALTLTEEFVNVVTKNKCGIFKYNKGEVRFDVDLGLLTRSKIPSDTIESAYKAGLVTIGFETLSSGEAAITHQLASISHAVHELSESGKDKFVVFIDEGDMLLHLSWQRKYLELIDSRLSNIRENLSLKSIQVIIATHSPLLTSDVTKRGITRLTGEGATPSFAAPLQEIVNYSFGTTAVGAIAEKTINRLKEKKVLSEADMTLIAQIDDDFIREYLCRK